MPTKADADSAQLQRKATVIEEIRQRLDASDAAVLTEYRGSDGDRDREPARRAAARVDRLQDLQEHARPPGRERRGARRARRAARGPVAIAFVRQDGGDAVTAAKALRDFARTNPNLIVKGGILGTRLLTTKEVEALADVPPRDELLARLAGGFQAPARQGRRPVPGLHEELRLRPEGLRRPARRRRRSTGHGGRAAAAPRPRLNRDRDRRSTGDAVRRRLGGVTRSSRGASRRPLPVNPTAARRRPSETE